MSIINSNIQSLAAQQAMVVNGRQLSSAMNQLATGRRVNSAADDAAGMAIGNKLNSQVISLAQAVRNAGDGISLMQTADGAAGEMTNMLVRMRELAIQSRNGTNSAADQAALNTEYTALRSQIQQITTHTQWNGMKIIGGDKSTVNFNVGASDNDRVQVVFKNLWASAVASGISGTDILSSPAIDSAMAGIDRAMESLDKFRATLGASMNRLNYAADNAMNVMVNSAASRSRILDTDYAKSTSALARAQIVQQAGMAMLSQANQTPRMVLMLLR